MALTILLFYSVCSVFFIDISNISINVIRESVLISVISLALYVLRNEYDINSKGQFVTISNLLILSIFIVHFLNYINYLIDSSQNLFLNDHVVNKVSRISAIAFTAFVLGLSQPVKPFAKRSFKKHVNSSRLITVFFLFSLFLFVAFTDRRYFSSGGNMEILNGEGMSTFGAIGNVTCIASVIAYVTNIIQQARGEVVSVRRYFSYFGKPFILILLVYLSLVVLSGDRGPIIDSALCIGAGLIIICKKKVKAIPAIFLIFLAAFFLTILAIIRATDMEMSFEKIALAWDVFKEYMTRPGAFFIMFKELSNLTNSFNLIADYVEANGIIYGKGIIFQTLAFLPGIRKGLWLISGVDTSTLSTDVLASQLLDKGIGAGTTCISDVYFNLGIVGTPILFILFGILIRKLQISMYDKNVSTFVLVVAIAYFMKSIYIGRSTVFQPINLIVYSCLYLYFSRYLTRLFNKIHYNVK